MFIIQWFSRSFGRSKTTLLFCFVLCILLIQFIVVLLHLVLYKPSTSFSFCLKMFLSSPRVDSIFSKENWFSPSAVLSLATQELSSVTVLSRRTHSLTKTSTFLTQVSETDLTLSYLSLRPATSASASACVVIFWAADLAASRTFRKLTQFFSKVLTLSSRALTWSRSDGLASPSAADFSAPSNQGLNSLMPVLYSAQYLTSLEYLSHSTLVSAWSFLT